MQEVCSTPVSAFGMNKCGTFGLMNTRSLCLRKIGCELVVPADGRLTYTVRLTPGSTREIPPGVISPGTAESWTALQVLPEYAVKEGSGWEVRVRPVRSRAPERNWKSGGIAVCRDERTYFLFSFCEAPGVNGRRVLELKQQKAGRWGAVDGIAPGEHRAEFRWEYGTDYRMSIAVSAQAVTGILHTLDGAKVARVTVPRTGEGEAVASGNAALYVSGLQIFFSDMKPLR